MILVVNKRFHKPTAHDCYVARPSKFGNQFTHLKNKTGVVFVPTREEAIRRYGIWFNDNLPRLKFALEELAAYHKKNGALNLICWCAGQDGLTTNDKPFICHAQIISEYIETL